MICNINYKKIISLLLLGLALITGLLCYKEQTTIRKVPGRADYVKQDIERIKTYG